MYILCRNTIFGKSIIVALRGGACTPENKTVSALDMFQYIRAFISKTVERINTQNSTEYRPESQLPVPVSVYQTPVLFVPSGMRQLAKNPIFFKCDPPAAPDRPYVSIRMAFSRLNGIFFYILLFFFVTH